MNEPSATRRGVLATTGAALFAGCSDSSQSTATPEISAVRLQQIGDDAPALVVADSRPVDIEETELAASVQRVTSLGETLPLPLGPDQIPNGYIRERLTTAARNATDRVADARTAPTRLVALESLHRARSQARYAAAGWGYVETDLTASTLEAEHEALVSAAQSVRSDYAYLGTDPVTAALVHGLVEAYLDEVITDSPGDTHETSQLLRVAAWGEGVEVAQAQLAAARYLSTRFRSSLPADADTVRTSLTTAVDTLKEHIRQRQQAMPAEPTDPENRLRGRIQNRLRSDATDAVGHVENAPGPASKLLTATEGLTTLLAHERFTDRRNADATFSVETASGVEATREAAVGAIESALDESTRPALARPILADTARSIRFADRELARSSRTVQPAQLTTPLFRYTVATLRANSVPSACRHTLDALNQ